MKFIESLINYKIALILVALIGLYVFLSKNEYRLFLSLKNDSKKIEQEIERLNSESRLLKLQTEDLKNSKRTLEIKGRSELGLVKEDEIIYEVSK